MILCTDLITRASLPAAGLHHCADEDFETGVLLAPGETVKVHSLQSQTSQKYNGAYGVLTSYDDIKGRWDVKLRGVCTSRCVCVCVCNM